MMKAGRTMSSVKRWRYYGDPKEAIRSFQQKFGKPCLTIYAKDADTLLPSGIAQIADQNVPAGCWDLSMEASNDND